MSLFSVCQGSYRVSWLVLYLLFDALLLPGLCPLRAAPPPSAPPASAQSAQSTERSRMNLGFPPDLQTPPPKANSEGPKQAQLKANFEKMKSDAAALAELANSLKADLDKANPNQFPSQLYEKVEQINKIARRMRKATGNL